VLGDRVGVDLWNYRTADGRSLRQGLDFLVPFASGERKWIDAQITDFRASTVHGLLRRAAMAWKEPKYRALADRIGGGSPRLAIVYP
jgi:hypothetical protein